MEAPPQPLLDQIWHEITLCRESASCGHDIVASGHWDAAMTIIAAWEEHDAA